MSNFMLLCLLPIPLTLKVLYYVYVFILAIAILACAMAHKWLYINYLNKLPNYSSDNPLQLLKRPRNIKELWRLEKLGQLNDTIVGKWIRIFIYSRRTVIAIGVPFFLLLTIFGIILFTYKGAP